MYPEPDTDASTEGDKAHELAAGLIADAAKGVYQPSDNEAVNMYVEYVRDLMQSTGVFTPHIEERVRMPNINELMWGTVDCWLFDKKTVTLHVIDFKHGHGLVEAFENWQLMSYVFGIFNDLDVNGVDDQYINVCMTIVQPNGFHKKGPIRTWETKASNLRGYANRLIAAAGAALMPDPDTKTGPHCKYCPARLHCEAALRAGNDLYEATGKINPIDLSPAQMGTQLALVNRAIAHLSSLQTALNSQVENTIKQGKVVPGFITEQSYGRQNWSKPFEEVVMLGEMYDVKVTKDTLVTPKQAQKLGIDESVIMAYSEKKSTGVKVVEDKTNKAKEVFTQ
jgi:hypothetical protein